MQNSPVNHLWCVISIVKWGLDNSPERLSFTSLNGSSPKLPQLPFFGLFLCTHPITQLLYVLSSYLIQSTSLIPLRETSSSATTPMKKMGWGWGVKSITRSKPWGQEKRLWWRISNTSQWKEIIFLALKLHLAGHKMWSFWPMLLEQFLFSAVKSGWGVEIIRISEVCWWYCLIGKESHSPYYVMSNTCPLLWRWGTQR